MTIPLDAIARKHGTDKSSAHHGYTKYYQQFFEPLRDKPIVLWECGYGGYHYPARGGEGARTWREYFPNATIVSIDKYPKTNVPEGIHFHQGEQDDEKFWNQLVQTYGPPDIFIIDASHINTLDIRTFIMMFFFIKQGGILVWEDIESSWWEEPASDGQVYYGCADHKNYDAYTSINFLRWLINDVNAKHIKNYQQHYPVESIHFFNNIVFVKKK